ncbi:MAG: glucosyl-3-phosphoglycerate synthase [Blastocatellia bacterium]
MSTAVEDRKSLLRDWSILLPTEGSAEAEQILPLALRLLGSRRKSFVHLLGVTAVAAESSLSEAALTAQALRNELGSLATENAQVRHLAGSLVSHHPWQEIESLIEERMKDDDLLLLRWRDDNGYFESSLERVLRDPPCNLVIAQPAAPPRQIKRILLPVRGGPYANLSLQLAVRLARSCQAEITLLRVVPSEDDAMSQALRDRFTGLSDTFPEITTELQVVGDAGAAILRELKTHQAVILGASAAKESSPIGLVARLILQRSDVTALVVKTTEPFRLPSAVALRQDMPVLLRVEKWFAENTFHSREFSDIGRLIDLKRKNGLRISLGLPALNEEATIGNVIHTLKTALMDDAPLLDEIVLIDSNSTDFTRKLAAQLGVVPYVHQDVLPGLGSLRGKGEALWKSLYLLKGDLIVWVDTDITNPHPRLVYGILGPLLADPRVQFVKGFYKRRVKDNGEASPAGGGRVTELLARPLINLFFPELSGLVQPLAGIYGGRRTALEQVPFYSGYGVEIGLLLAMLNRLGLKAIAQVDLEEVAHRNQELRALSKMSFAILQVFARHLREKGVLDGQLPIERTMKILRSEDQQFHLEEVDIYEQMRPPMIEVKEYAGRHEPLKRPR